ncbi:3-hydroxyacyl-CoA dehydrogenase [Hydrogenophaga sp. D2P1]|uniref:3-hydroxyacyl-CoA dehydrogenase n=1 Tax=Hydrogenophaga aromaticivorans TaxID=2610898 RepID=A0A7Y8GTY1_9BURK|nr:3-hydroxyacyl-CoA dehydrogenase [Hydrogenophaga aromaticivorans]NWF44779.1 3-hydroxyacyl-CoA dehydrogenase [Hydrogenophaga aromaticivorans]
MTSLNNAPVLVVGAGIMGAGIAQVAAQAGHPVFLFDMREGAAAQAKAKLAATLDGLVAKGKITAEAAAATLARIEPIPSLDAAAGAALVVEAIVENLDAKRSLFRQLESVVGEAAILASNTSSISVTAIANGLLHPERFVGMHFFNPVPQMKLVEVVSGLQTDAAVAQAIEALSVAWGKVPVHARSTPGFIVNRIARPYYAETLALLQEQAATPQRLDACLKAAGFRMGPCELMDLIGHDTNFAVTNSVFEANFGDKRYVPSLVQRELVDGGLLGRKSGRGFYTYPEGAPALPATAHEVPLAMGPVTVHGDGEIADRLEQLVAQGGLSGDAAPSRQRQTWVGLDIGGARLVLTDGRTAGDIAAREGVADVAVFDRPLLWPAAPGGALAYAVAPQASAGWRQQAPAWLAALGFAPVPLADAPGLVVARTIAMLINEAADAVQQGVCTPEGADAAMKLGVNYPAGPFEWLARWSVAGVTQVMESLDAYYRGERYRISPWLRRQRA